MLEVVRLGYDMLEVVNIFQDISLSQLVQRRPIARVTVGLSVAGQVSGSDSRLGPSPNSAGTPVALAVRLGLTDSLVCSMSWCL